MMQQVRAYTAVSCTHVYLYICTCIFECMYACVYVLLYVLDDGRDLLNRPFQVVCTPNFIYTRTNAHMLTYKSKYVHTYVYIYTYIHTSVGIPSRQLYSGLRKIHNDKKLESPDTFWQEGDALPGIRWLHACVCDYTYIHIYIYIYIYIYM